MLNKIFTAVLRKLQKLKSFKGKLIVLVANFNQNIAAAIPEHAS